MPSTRERAGGVIDSGAWQTELTARRRRARELADAVGAEALLVFGSDRRGQAFRYLTGFEPVLGDMWLALGDEARCAITFEWQLAEARAASGIDHWQAAPDPVSLVAAAVRETGAQRVAVAGLDRVPLSAHATLVDAVPGLTLLDVGNELASERRRKSPLEIEALRAAARVTDQMLDAARTAARSGVTENAIAAQLVAIAATAGGTLAFESAVIGGVDDPIPIRRPSDRPLRRGDTLMVDVGADIGGYQGDASRTFVLGAPSAAQTRGWDVVRRAYDAVLALCRPGVRCLELQRAAVAIVEDAGFRLPHRVGHGIGLATSYEWPSLDTETAELEPGMTICIEPAICAEQVGTMKIEDDVLITDSGCELLTTSDQALEVRP